MVSASLHRSAFALVGLTGFLLVFGSTVRVHGAGLACPDWPLCFGQVVPEVDFKVGLEFGHRVVAGFVSLGFLGLGAAAVRSGVWAASARVRTLWLLAAVALAVQVVLGGLTVLELLAEWTVASHLVTGNTFCTLLLLLALSLREHAREVAGVPARPEVGAAQRALAAAFLLLVPAQVVLGGLVAGSHAGLACGTWPSCNGAGWFPTFEGLVGLQVTHRIMAYTLLGAGVVNLFVQGAHPRLRTPSRVLMGVLLVQASLGVANVLLRMPVEVTLAHSAGAAALFLTSGWQAFLAFMSPVASSVRVGAPLEAT